MHHQPGPSVLNPEICKGSNTPPHRPSFLSLSPRLSVQKQPSQKEPEDSPVLISKSCYQDPPKMKGFYFLLFTISFLIMIQVRAAPSPWHHCPRFTRPACIGGRDTDPWAPRLLPWEQRQKGSSRQTKDEGGVAPAFQPFWLCSDYLRLPLDRSLSLRLGGRSGSQEHGSTQGALWNQGEFRGLGRQPRVRGASTHKEPGAVVLLEGARKCLCGT